MRFLYRKKLFIYITNQMSLTPYANPYAAQYRNRAFATYMRNHGARHARGALQWAWNKWNRAPPKKARRPYVRKAKPKPAAQTAAKASRRNFQGRHVLPGGQRNIRTLPRVAMGRSVTKPLSLKTITDMLCPLVKEEYSEPKAEINWVANHQGYGMYYALHKTKLDEMYNKVTSTDVQNITKPWNMDPVAGSRSSTMKYCGGYTEYTVINSCNHTIEVLFNTFKPKRRLALTLYECWDKDLHDDGTISSTTVPINVERDKADYGTPIIQKSNPKSYVTFNYQLTQSKRVILAVGETYVYTVKHTPFVYDIARENMHQNNSGDTFKYSPSARVTSIIARSQLVVGGTGSTVAHGSGKVAVAEKLVNFMRPGLEQKRYQTYNHGGLDQLADNDQFHYNVDDDSLDQYTTS